MKRINLIIIFLTTILSCQLEKSGQDSFSSPEAKQAISTIKEVSEENYTNNTKFKAVSEPKIDNSSSNSTSEKKLIKTANIRYQVLDINDCINKIQQLVADSNAVITTNNQENYSYQIAYNLVIRVDNQKFDGLVDAIVSLADQLNSKQVNAQDVTEQFVDITARLNAKKKIEERYLEILNQAKNIEDILEVEKKLGEIREEIESTEGRLRYLNNQIALSTIHLSFYQTLEQETSSIAPGFFSRIGKGFANGWDIFLDFIVSLSYIWPFILISIILIYFIKKFLSTRQKKV